MFYVRATLFNMEKCKACDSMPSQTKSLTAGKFHTFNNLKNR